MALTTIPAAGAKLRGSVLSALITEVRDLYVEKTSDESVTSSTVLQDDDELLLAVEANATYHGAAWLVVTGGNAAGDFKHGFSFPTGAVCDFPAIAPHDTLASSTSVIGEFLARIGATSGTTFTPSGASTSGTTRVDGLRLVTGANAGNLQLMWAQNASNATPTVLEANSWMWLRRVA